MPLGLTTSTAQMAGIMAGTQTPRATPDSLFSTDSGLLGEYVFCVSYDSPRSGAIPACFTIPDVCCPYPPPARCACRGGSLSQNHRRLRRARDRVQKAMKNLTHVFPRWEEDAKTAQLRRFGLHTANAAHVSSFRHVIHRYQRDTSALLHQALGDQKQQLYAAMGQLQSWLDTETAQLKHFETQLDDMEDTMVPRPVRGAQRSRLTVCSCGFRMPMPCTLTKQRRTYSVKCRSSPRTPS